MLLVVVRSGSHQIAIQIVFLRFGLVYGIKSLCWFAILMVWVSLQFQKFVLVCSFNGFG